MSENLTDSEVFQLAGYAHAKLAPLIAEAQTIEPSIELRIELNFTNANVELGEGHVSVFGHWARPDMFLYSTWNRTKADIDHDAEGVSDSIEKLRAEA